MSTLFDEILVRPIINILVAIYQLLNFVHIPFALGFSIIILTVVIRLILYPLISSQLKASKKMQDLAPHLSNLKNKHKGDAKRLQAETMRLYKEHGVNPMAGCLPMIIQLPIIWALYSVLQKIVALNSTKAVTEINSLLYSVDLLKLTKPWDTNFFGIPLGQNPSHLVSVIPLIVLVPVLTGFLQFIQSKMLFTKQPDLNKNDKKKKEEDFSSAFQSQSMYIFPVMIGFFSYQFPIGLSLYWNTFTLFGILQQYQIQGWGGLKQWKDKTQSIFNK